MSIEISGLKAIFKKKSVLVGLVFIAIFFVLIMMIKSLNGSNESEAARDMQNQKDRQVSGNVHYTTEETLSTLTGETANIQKGLSNVVQQVSQFKNNQSQKTQSSIVKMQKALAAIKAENEAMREKMKAQISQIKTEKSNFKDKGSLYSRTSDENSDDINSQNSGPYAVGGAGRNMKDGLIWLKNESPNIANNSNGKDLDAASNGSLLHPGSTGSSLSSLKPKVIPAFTIPANTMLTGVTPEQPLVGMIPKNGTVVNPQSVLFMVGQKNLAANNWHLPSNLKGIQGNAICQGVFVWFNDAYANCRINSLTFIFQDGRIATSKAVSGKSFGHLTTKFGSPNIPGRYHGNAAYAGMGTGLFAGIQGFGNAYAMQQQQVSSVGTQTIISYKNAFDGGLGSGVGNAGQYANQWWHSLLKSTTDFVFVPNWNSQTHQILQLNAVITNQVDINYNPTGRKVNYDNFNESHYNNSLN